MKSIKSYILETLYTFENCIGEIRFELDNDSKQLLLEGNRIIHKDYESTLKIGDHATQRENRPVDKGGDGEPIEESEIINMFKWSWADIIDMYKEGFLQRTEETKYFIIQCKCYIKEENNKLYTDGARPEEKHLWAAWMVVENFNTGKIDIIIRTIFRGSFFRHRRNQERILIANNGYVKRILPK